MQNFVYLDNAATTIPFAELEQIYSDNATNFYNPSALYKNAVAVRTKIEAARRNICKILGGEHGNIIFTSGATEANNLALNSVNYKNKGLLTFVAEHPSVYATAKNLQNSGVKVEFLNALKGGQVRFPTEEQIKSAAIISVMHVNNETGAINDIKKIASYAKSINPQILVHSDGVQAFGKIKVDLQDLGVDMYTISAHKINGPKGVGALWIRRGVNVKPLLFGGGQENNLRSGTENVFGILALNYCTNKIVTDLEKNNKKLSSIKEQFLNSLKSNNLNFTVNGENCVPNILNISINGIRGEVLLHMLEDQNILLSTGSACSSKKPDNRTLKSMNLQDPQIKSAVRISFSAYQDFDVQSVANAISVTAKKLQNNIKNN